MNITKDDWFPLKPLPQCGLNKRRNSPNRPSGSIGQRVVALLSVVAVLLPCLSLGASSQDKAPRASQPKVLFASRGGAEPQPIEAEPTSRPVPTATPGTSSSETTPQEGACGVWHFQGSYYYEAVPHSTAPGEDFSITKTVSEWNTRTAESPGEIYVEGTTCDGEKFSINNVWSKVLGSSFSAAQVGGCPAGCPGSPPEPPLPPNPPGPDPEPTPTTGPTATPTPEPLTLTIEDPRKRICAGGWDQRYKDGLGGYFYLSKEKADAHDADPWVERDRAINSSDPHVITLTIAVAGGEGDLEGRVVTLHCDMPGPDPVQDVTATTDEEGIARATIISGDELSLDTDEEGQQLFNKPVSVDISCGEGDEQVMSSVLLDVVAPTIEWQIKNPDGNYASWDGDAWDNYYNFEESHDVPLRALLTFNGVPVFGHRVSWGFEKIVDKAEVEVARSDADYATYGHMSGEISTTRIDGGATATYSLGYSFGQITYAIDDASTYKPGSRLPLDFGEEGLQASPAMGSTGQPLGGRRSRRTFYKGKHTGVYRFVHDSAFNDIDGRPNSIHKEAYPAPSGSERNELLPETLSKVTEILSKVSNTPVDAPKMPGGESTTGWRLQDFIGPGGERRFFQHGSWWFAQVVGDDPESFGTHKADVKVPVAGKSTFNRYSGAFDIVLTGVPIFLQVRDDPRNNGRRAAFGSYVKAMRDNGFVAWHRWAGESFSTSENEMHCIDPKTPFLKSSLDRQIDSFILDKGTGGNYPSEPDTGDFAIVDDQIGKVRSRRANKFQTPGAMADNQ